MKPLDRNANQVVIKNLGLQLYEPIWQAMRQLIANRTKADQDEIWCLEHHPVYTLGQASLKEHLICPPEHIPVIQVDRGGQVTYHGPGQLVIYLLLDLERLKLGPKTLVQQIEQSILNVLSQFEIIAHRINGSPGIFIDAAKIASLGLRIRKGYCYHGLALNVSMDLKPFQWINPCGQRDLKVVQLVDFLPNITLEYVKDTLVTELCKRLGYDCFTSKTQSTCSIKI